MSARYKHTGLVLVRASTDPGDLEPVPTHLDLSDPIGVEQHGRAWLETVWARSEVREALRLASTTLAARVDQLLDDTAEHHSVKELRRAVVSVASYLLRWQRRATPFGMFAGVGVASIGPAMVDMGVRHRAVARADAEWLATLIEQLERNRALRSQLTVVADSARIVRDGRVIVQQRAELGASDPGQPRECSVRLNQAVRFALSAAGSPIRFAALAAELTARFSAVPPDKINALLHGLVDAGLLITSLRAPMTTIDTLSHLIDALRAAGAEDLADVVGLVHELDEIGALLARHNSTIDREQAATIRTAVTARMTRLTPSPGQALAVDMRLDATIAVPERVLTEAALAASALLRVSTQPFGSAAWLDYHARFRARYGPGALVPVRELVADSGLGYPSGYLGAPRARPAWRMLTERDAALLALIQQATMDAAEDIALTGADIDALTIGEHADIVAPQRIELGVTVHACSTEAVDRGEFQLWVTAAPRTPTSMAGRFAHLLDDADRARLVGTYTVAGPAGSMQDEAVPMQLSFPPRRPHNENVVRVPPLLPDVVSVSEHPDPACPDLRVIDVDDVAVTADAEQMYLVQRSTGRRVIPRIPHALDTRVQSPPLARFLAEVADARGAVFGGFDLGAARTLPYIPRIRYRRTVLAAARWIVTSADVRGRVGQRPAAALHCWRQRWRVPARVVLCHGELRLPLDLDHELDRALLRAEVERAGRIEVQEDGPPGGQGWIGRPAELLIPMTAITPAARPLPATAAPGAVLRPGDSAVVHAQLIGNPARFDEILAAHLPRLIDDLQGLVGPWWARRCRDMIRPETDQHLAVFLRLTCPEHYGQAAATLAAFAADLETRSLPCQLTLASHPQHPARYGRGPALAAAEQVFATDTAAAIAQIRATQTSGIPAQAIAAASMVDLAASFAPHPQAGHRALIDCLPREHGPLDRMLRDRALALADSDEGYRAVRVLPGGEAVVAAWSARAGALTAYYHALGQQQHDPGTVLRALLHEHHVRAVGVDPTLEKETSRLARAAALRRLALASGL